MAVVRHLRFVIARHDSSLSFRLPIHRDETISGQAAWDLPAALPMAGAGEGFAENIAPASKACYNS
jgi:hypothetical protein